MSLLPAAHAQHDGLQWYAEAEMARKKGLFPEALEKYTEALRREPNNYRYLYGKAQILEKFRKADEALALLNQAVRIRSNFAPIYTLMAEIYRNHKSDPERAAQLFNIAYKNETDPKARLQLKFEVIRYFVGIRDYETALKHISEAKLFASGYLELHYFDAWISNILGRYTSAQATLMVVEPKLRTLHISESARFYYELGYAYFKQNEYEQAYQVWKRAYYGDFKSRINRYHPNYYFQLASAYAEMYELETSRIYLGEVLKIRPEMPEAYLLQSDLLKKAARHPERITLHEKALSLTTNNAQKSRIYLQLAELYLQQQDYKSCLKAAREGISLSPQVPELYFFEVVALFHLERPLESRPSLETLIQNTRFNTKKSLYLFWLGMTYQREGNSRKALELFSQVADDPYKTAALEESFQLQKSQDAY